MPPSPPPLDRKLRAEHHHRRIRHLGLAMWVLVILYAASAMAVGGAQLLLCAGPVDWPLTCRDGSWLPGLLGVGLGLGLGLVLREVAALGREATPGYARRQGSRWQALLSSPREIRWGMGHLQASHHRHVRNSTRFVFFTLGLALTYLAFYQSWGGLEAGAWLILLGFVLAGEALIWGAGHQARQGPA